MNTLTKIIQSRMMGVNNEFGIVRTGEDEARRLGLNIGDSITIGDEESFVIKRAYEEDTNLFGDSTLFISGEDYKKVPECLMMPGNNVNPVRIGCDPEFVLTNIDGKFIDASYIFSKFAALGSDIDLGEIRPNPSYRPGRVVENIRKLILLMSDEDFKYIPVGSSFFNGRSIGFHIHFQIPKALILFAAENTKNIIANIVHILDCFIGTPSILFEDNDKRRLSSSEYGKPGDFRISDNTLEYRTAGGIYLRHPLYTKRLLYTANLVMGNILARLEKDSILWTDASKIQNPSYFSKLYELPGPTHVKYLLSKPNRDPIKKMLAGIRNNFFKNIIVPDKYHSLITDFLYLTKEDVGESLIESWT